MATRNLDIVIAARDEASSTFKRVGQQLHELELEGRHSGERSIERTLKGAGAVGLALEGVRLATEGATAFTEGMKKVAEGTGTVSQAVGAGLQQVVEGVPVIGTLVKSFGELGDSIMDWAAASRRADGMSEEMNESMMSEAQQLRELNVLTQDQTRITHDLADSRLALLKVTGSPQEIEEAEALERLNKALEENYTKQRAFLAEHGDKIANLGEQERNLFKGILKEQLDAREAYNAEQVNSQRKIDNSIEEQSLSHIAKMHELAHEGSEDRKRAAGLTFDASREDVIAKRQAELQKIRNDSERDIQVKHLKEGSEEILQVRKQADDAQTDVKAAAAAELAAIDDQQKQEEARQEFEHTQTLAGLRAKAYEQQLNNDHRQGEARVAALDSQYDEEAAAAKFALEQQIAELEKVDDDAAREKIAKLKQRAAEEAQARTDAFMAQRAGIVQQNENEKADKQEAIDHELAENKIGALREQASLGIRSAEIEAQRLELADKYKSEREKILKILRDEKDLTASQRNELQSELDQMDARQAKAKAALELSFGIGLEGARSLLPTLEEDTGGTSAFGEQEAESLQNSRVDPLQQAIADNTGKIADAMGAFVDWMKNSQNAAPPTRLVFGQ